MKKQKEDNGLFAIGMIIFIFVGMSIDSIIDKIIIPFVSELMK